MKSAYERAMERMEAESGPVKKLSEDGKQRIAEIDKRLDAKIAELKLACEAKLPTASSHEEAQTLQKELATDIAASEQQREEEKATVWNSAEE